MKTLVFIILALSLVATAHAASTINTTNRYAYGANIGWMDWRGDNGTNGAVIGEYVCSGYLYAANVGWINLGSGVPADGIQYQNTSATDFGVNQDGLGNLRGYAYGANVGWINFEDTGAPRVDLMTGNLSGHAYSANCGWISLSNVFAFVQTDTIAKGEDTDGDSIADAWELTYTNTLSAFTATSDTDNDGQSDLEEYLAGTNPLDANDNLCITAFGAQPGGTTATVTWKSVLSRYYYLQNVLDLNSTAWTDSGLDLISPDGSTTTRSVSDTNAPMRFYRVQAVRPLAP
ncbi:MAG: thrombospondin type 3 repeat-containing protein [Verrucomicrobiota bacterium]|jgi:hypothetical protein